MKPRQMLWAMAAGQVVLAAGLGWHFRHALNTDAVAYLRIAGYYAEGNTALAMSGYWGPLLSWLIAGFLKLGAPELAAGRLAMGVSALVFLWGCAAVLESFRLSRRWFGWGAGLAAVVGAWWSVLEITPDLLLAGILALATGRLLRNRASGIASDALTGALWGLAFLTKAVALPLAALVWLALARLDFLRDRETASVRWHNWLVRGAALAVVAAPWVTALSLKYHRLTFSTTARISHTITGPSDVDRYHPFARSFHPPEPGRVTSWEEPSLMPYRVWSPWERADYLRHQLKVLGGNVVTIAALLTSVNPGWWLLLAALWRGRATPSSSSPARGELARTLVMPLALAGVYLPFSVLISQQRFFYAAFPFFFAGLALWADAPAPRWLAARLKSGFVMLATGLPLLAAMLFIGDATRRAGACAFELANRIRAAGLSGPVAGSGSLPGGRAGLYVSFHLRQPWHGDELNPTPDGLKNSGARLAIVRRNSPLTQVLAVDTAFENLDARLFANDADAVKFPLQVFAIHPAGAAP